jgi:sulfide:quinone oxidoreductase
LSQLKKILILGAGTAGSIVANKLARELRREIAQDKIEITILDKDPIAVNRAGFTFVPFGYLTKHDLMRDKRFLISPRVKYHFGENGSVTKIDLEKQEVQAGSKSYKFDFLVISTGSTALTDSVKGLSQDFNTFYTSIDDAQKLGQKIASVKQGRIVILVPKMPIPCPGAPGKFSILLSDYLQYVRGEQIRNKIEIELLWPTKAIGPPAYNSVIEKAFEDKKIKLSKPFVFDHVNEKTKQVISQEGNSVKYDLLVTVPPFSTPDALRDSELAVKGGWIMSDKSTLQYSNSKKHENVFVIGDNGNPEIPKTGVAAHYQALITAQNIINKVQGIDIISPYRGEAGCPFVGSSYTPHTRGKAYIPVWTYDRLPDSFPPTELGWLFYRMYYYLHWDTTIKALA